MPRSSTNQSRSLSSDQSEQSYRRRTPRSSTPDDSATDSFSSSEGYSSRDDGRSNEPVRRGTNREGVAGSTTTMRSLPSWPKWSGIQRTQIKHILHPDETSQNSASTPLVDSSSFDKRGGNVSPPSHVDPEKQTSEKRNSTAQRVDKPGLSLRRKLYFVATLLICIALIVIGVVLGMKAYRTREEAVEKGMVDEKLIMDHTSLLQQGHQAQEALGVENVGIYAIDGEPFDEDDEELEEEEQVPSNTAPSIVGNVLDPFSATAVPTFTVESPEPQQTLARVAVTSTDPALVSNHFADLQNLFNGNDQFVNETNFESPGLLKALGRGQTPKFAFLGCSDSRVSETVVLGANIGDLFVTRNVGNLFVIDSLSTESVFSYAIQHLGVQHIIVMGHTKCGAVQAAIVAESKDTMYDIGENRIMTWIRPIRTLYASSTRSEIVKFRDRMKSKQCTLEDVTSEVWNALIEENVKSQVRQLALDPSVLKSWKTWGENQRDKGKGKKRSTKEEEIVELWIHGWVYDVDTGIVHDMGYSVGPKVV